MPIHDMPQQLIDLAAEGVVGAPTQGAFKYVQPLSETKGYVAAIINRNTASRNPANMEDLLKETKRQLKLRKQALEEKARGGTEYRGGRHIVKTVGFDPSGRVIMKGGGSSLAGLVAWQKGGLTHMLRSDSTGASTKCLKNLMASVAKQVLEGLKFLHARNKVHSDIKLDNILISSLGKVTLIDFGTTVSTNKPWKGGTRGYLSPRREAECRQGRPFPNARVTEDLYALGCTLMHWLSGQRTNPNLQQSAAAVQVFGSRKLVEFVSKLMSEELPGACGRGYSTAQDALQDPFVLKSQRAHSAKLLGDYLGSFSGAAAPAPAAASASAAATATGNEPPHLAWQKFAQEFPDQVGLLEEVTQLAAEAAKIKAAQKWKAGHVWKPGTISG